MVLPWPERVKRREVDVGVLARRGAPADALDVDADEVVADLGHLGAADAGFEDAENADEPVEKPDCACRVNPVVRLVSIDSFRGR